MLRLLHAAIQPFQQEERAAVGFFWTYRHLYPFSRPVLRDIASQYHNWVQNLTRFTPFFTPEERKHAGVKHRLFFAQVELCDNLIFRRRAAVDALEQRLLDANRTIGQPNKLTLIFGRRITRYHGGKIQTVIEDLNLANSVIRSHYRKGFVKQYVRDRFLLRTEPATNNVYTDYGVGKAVENLPPLREKLDGIIDRYLDVQQDILETFVDREQLHQLTQPTLLPSGRRIPGLKFDQPRQLALMHSLVRFCYLAAEGTFTTRDLYPQTLQALRRAPEEYKLASLRYDLWKLRAKGLVEKIPHSRRYRLLARGYQICVVFLKLYERIYAPLTAGILRPLLPMTVFPKKKGMPSIAAILPSSRLSTLSSRPLVSRPPKNQAPKHLREQNSHLGPHNGL